MSSTMNPRSGGRHPLNIGHLVMGLAFVGIATVWLIAETGVVGDDDVRWLFPLPWVLAGTAGIIAWVVGMRREEPPARR